MKLPEKKPIEEQQHLIGRQHNEQPPEGAPIPRCVGIDAQQGKKWLFDVYRCGACAGKHQQYYPHLGTALQAPAPL